MTPQDNQEIKAQQEALIATLWEKIKQHDTRLHFLNKQAGTRDKTWFKRLHYSELSPEEKNQANLREQLPDEIILDLEEADRMEGLKQQLIQDGISFSLWKTSSRGYHFHIVFPTLTEYAGEQRKQIRKSLIEHYGCDTSVAQNFIALEGRLHFKTLTQKKHLVFVHETNKPNILPAQFITPPQETTSNTGEKYLMHKSAIHAPKRGQTRTSNTRRHSKIPTIEEINSSVNILQAVRYYGIEAQMSGHYAIIRCPNPYHEDKNPSCAVYPETNSFHCFSCQQSGDCFQFIRLMEESK